MTDEPIKITLRLPDPCLSPNARVNWRVKHGATKKYRRSAFLLATEQAGACPGLIRATQQATFYYPTKRRRDGDNLLSMLKPVWDGLVDAGVLDDDAGLIHMPVKVEIDKENPRVEIEIRESP